MAVVDSAVYVDGRRTAEADTLDHAFEVLRRYSGDGSSFCWIGMLRPTAQEIATVADKFNLPALAVEDAVHAHQRPKFERYGDTWFVVLRPARYVDPVEVVELGELHGAVALSDGGQTRPLSALHQTASASSAKAADS